MGTTVSEAPGRWDSSPRASACGSSRRLVWLWWPGCHTRRPWLSRASNAWTATATIGSHLTTRRPWLSTRLKRGDELTGVQALELLVFGTVVFLWFTEHTVMFAFDLRQTGLAPRKRSLAVVCPSDRTRSTQ